MPKSLQDAARAARESRQAGKVIKPPKPRSSEADRGKLAEMLVHKALLWLQRRVPMLVFERILDARSAWRDGDRDPKVPPRRADFEVQCPKGHFLIEVKETAELFVLPRKNFPLEQRNLLHKWVLAGAKGLVVVRQASAGCWCQLPYEMWSAAPTDTGSWDLRQLPKYDTIEALLDLELGE